MSLFTDQTYLREQQYRDDSNLRARMELHRRFTTNPEPWHRWALDRFEFPPEARILEVGCGPGELWFQNVDRIPPGWQLTLADLSPGMVEKARESLGERAEYRVADVQELPFEDEAFDGVVANHMLYHVPDRPRAFREIRRVLCPGGLFYASTNGEDHLKEIKGLLAHESAWSMLFRLETGGEELSAFFVDVTVDLYPGDLEVTEAEPVVAFVRSFDHGEIDKLEETVEGVIAREGAFHVTKSSGLFSCRKP